MTTKPISGGQIGRSVPRLEARDKVTGRAEYTHTMRLPGMLYGKLFRSTVAHGRIKSIDTSAAQEDARACSTSSPSTTSSRCMPDPVLRPGVPRPADPGASRRCASSASRSPSCSPPIRMSPRQAAQLITAEYEELPAVFDEVEALTAKVYVHDELKPAGTFADLKHLKGAQEHQPRARLPAAPRRRRQGLRRRRAQVSSTNSARRRCCTCRSSRSPPSPTTRTPTSRSTAASQGPSFVRTEIARLLGWPENKVRIKVPYLGGGYGAKLYIKLEALVHGAVDDRAPAR